MYKHAYFQSNGLFLYVAVCQCFTVKLKIQDVIFTTMACRRTGNWRSDIRISGPVVTGSVGMHESSLVSEFVNLASRVR